jgi:hypothetical protein
MVVWKIETGFESIMPLAGLLLIISTFTEVKFLDTYNEVLQLGKIDANGNL